VPQSLRWLCVFCGARAGVGGKFAPVVRELGQILVSQGLGLVYGGASVGLMGLLADTVLAAGGECVGVITRDLVDREVAHAGLTRLEITETLAERKSRMMALSDAFVALPGGAGTLDELSEVWTTAQLGLHARPIGVLNVDGYFDRLLEFLDHAVVEGLLDTGSRALLAVASEPRALLGTLSRRPTIER
jgi:uncharacterized protein (TIGR00730 family)